VKTPPQTQTSSPDDNGRKIEILRAAALLFHKKGFDATSMNDIAKAVNLTKPGLYYYVQSKEDLLFAIMEHAMNQLQEAVINPAREQSNPEQCLAAIIENHARVVMEDRVITILTDEMAGLSPEHYELLIQRKQDYFSLLRSTLEELMAAGTVRPLNPTVMAFSIFGILLWLPRWFQPDGSLTREEVVAQVKEFIYGGIGQSLTETYKNPEKHA
jgi:AcrR family transcriptional regulator